MAEMFRVAECGGMRQAVGRGLFATQYLPMGAEVLAFCGTELTLSEVRLKGPLAANALQIDQNLYLDLVEPGQLLNHSCDPNVGVFDNRFVRALRAIEAGEELCFDYSTTVGDGWTMTCLCGAPGCRGIVRAFQTLPAELRMSHIVRGSVQRFLVEQLGA
jgi:hypothetical protein